jgi:serine/threonine protein phosphatase PrpC
MTSRLSSHWRVGGASIRGALHVRHGAPNQDAFFSQEDSASRAAIAAVADGHGASAHFRSGIGAELAVRAAGAVLEADLDDADGADLASAILARWRADVQAHMGAHPYAPDERALADYPPLSPYGATLIAAGANAGVLTLLQIGDGDLFLGYPDGRVEQPLPAGPELKGEQTFSLCQEDARRWFQSAVLWRSSDAPFPNFVFMATDGVSKSFHDGRAFRAEVARLHQLAMSDWDELLNGASDWLSTVSNNGSGDDATLCVAVRAAL